MKKIINVEEVVFRAPAGVLWRATSGVAKNTRGSVDESVPHSGSTPSTRESDGVMGPVILSSTELARMRQQVRSSSDVDGVARGRLPRRLAANLTTRSCLALPPSPCLTAILPHPNPAARGGEARVDEGR